MSYKSLLLAHMLNCAAFACLQIRLVQDQSTGKPRGYAFVEYASSRDMKSAFPSILYLVVRIALKEILVTRTV